MLHNNAQTLQAMASSSTDTATAAPLWSSTQATYTQMFAALDALGPRNESIQAFNQLLKNPLIAHLWPRLGNILKPALHSLITMMNNKKLQQTNALHQLIYLTMGSNNNVDESTVPANDTYLKAALLQRAAHAINLEVIFYKNRSDIIDFITTVMAKSYDKMLEKMVSDFIQNPSGMFSHMQYIISLYDYLPENKFLALFIHPSELWENGDYELYKANTNKNYMFHELRKIYSDMDTDYRMLEQLSNKFMNLRTEMLQAYDLLKQSDRELMQYCTEKNYDQNALFNLNKSVLLDLLKNCHATNADQDDELKNETDVMIICRIEFLERVDSWIMYSDEAVKLSISLSPIQELDPVGAFDAFAAGVADMPFTEIKLLTQDLSPAKLIELLNSVFTHFPKLKPSANIKDLVNNNLTAINGVRNNIIHYSKILQKIQRKGFASVRQALIDIFVSGELKHYMNQDLIKKLEIVFFNEDTLSPDERLKRYAKKGEYKKAWPLISSITDVYPYLKIALTYKQTQFVIDLLKVLKKRDRDIFTIIPDVVKRQEALLIAAINIINHDVKAARIIIAALLEYQPWNNKLLLSLGDQLDDPTIRNLFIPQKKSLSVDNSDSDDDTADVFNNGLESPSLLFPAQPFQPLISRENPLFKIRIFSEKTFSGIGSDVQCYALVMALIQFFQAYRFSSRSNRLLAGLSYEKARRVRNALVHQQVYDPTSQKYHLLLDGEGSNLMELARTLLAAVCNKNATALLQNALFRKILAHGAMLAKQQNKGERESVQFYHRVVYTRWLSSTASVFDRVQQVPADMLEHAKAALGILKQFYCLEVAGCTQAYLENARAKVVRHLRFKLPVVGGVEVEAAARGGLRVGLGLSLG